jgi:hypothetical protein
VRLPAGRYVEDPGKPAMEARTPHSALQAQARLVWKRFGRDGDKAMQPRPIACTLAHCE